MKKFNIADVMTPLMSTSDAGWRLESISLVMLILEDWLVEEEDWLKMLDHRDNVQSEE